MFKPLLKADQPIAVVLAGHNGSGKSTLWYERLSNRLEMPLVNADRLTMSLLPDRDQNGNLPEWATRLRDEDEEWQRLAQEGVQLFMGLAVTGNLSFAFETVFSHKQQNPDGTYSSKIDLIRNLQKNGYAVILIFVGLASVELSILRVLTRRQSGGHDVPQAKLRQRFPRTQELIREASTVADLTLMFDNSRSREHAFALARAQRQKDVLYDCRDLRFRHPEGLTAAAGTWLSVVAPAGM